MPNVRVAIEKMRISIFENKALHIPSSHQNYHQNHCHVALGAWSFLLMSMRSIHSNDCNISYNAQECKR